MRIVKCLLRIYLFMPLFVTAQKVDTGFVLRRLVNDLNSLNDLSYDYSMDAKLPNGDKDHLTGTSYANKEEGLYYNDCSAFTTIRSARWFYMADHKNKNLTIVDINKEAGRKIKKNSKNKGLENNNPITSLDSVVLGNGLIKEIGFDGNVYKISLSFKGATTFKTMDICYDTAKHLLISSVIVILKPWQRTPKGIQSYEVKITTGNYKRIEDKSVFDVPVFFSYKNNKIELKKYNNYKLTTKI